MSIGIEEGVTFLLGFCVVEYEIMEGEGVFDYMWVMVRFTGK